MDPFFWGFRSSLGGLKSEKMQTVLHENHFFENAAFWFFEAPDGSFGLILALLGRSDPKMGSKMSFNIFLKSGLKKLC